MSDDSIANAVILEKMADVKRQQKTQKDYKEWKKQNQNNETNSD